MAGRSLLGFRLERHRLGPRVYLFGHRIHEWHLGVAIIVASIVVAIAGPFEPLHALVATLLGAWLVAKDWSDLTSSRRDTAGWALGLHRRPAPLRPVRRLDDMPTIAALATAAIGVIDFVSAVTPNVSWRGRVLVRVEPVAVMRDAHALAVPASFALVLTAYYLYRRRYAAMRIALALLMSLTVFNLVKGLDIAEAALTFACAVLLWASRASFYGQHDPGTVRSAALRVPVLLCAAFLASLAVVVIAAPRTVSFAAALRETGDLLLWHAGPFGFRHELARMGLAVELISVLTLLTVAYMVLRPLAVPRDLPEPELRHAAAELVHEHGQDTLAFFKLRADMLYLFGAERAAFVGYQIEGGVMMISGDPVGEPPRVAALMRDVVGFAEKHSLRIAAIGVSPAGRELFERAGLRALYIGDEAIVDTDSFTLEGRAIRKVRQSVSRVEHAGYRTESAEVGELDEATMCELEQVADDWLAGAAERGFSMAMDSLRNPESAQTLIVYTTNPDGVIEGFLHFVPTYERLAVSLSFMRRRRDTPNGLTEYMIVKAIGLLRDQGISEVSLNFAAFARLIRDPQGLVERLAGRLIVLGDTWFQIERLYRFNAKFSPRWEPRYFMYERRFGLPRAGIAALLIEGHLPRPTSRTSSKTPIGP